MVYWDGWYPEESRTRRSYVDQRTTVQVHRAPTDESVRLLREMEKAAADKFKDSLRLESNNFNAVVTLHHSDIRGELTAVCIFNFNGDQFEAEATANLMEMARDKYAVVHKLRERVATIIAGNVLADAFLPLMREFGR